MQLPSNKKFGLFFTLIFLICFCFFLYRNSNIVAYIFLFLSISFFILSFLNPRLLYPLNKIWMSFGFLLGIIIKPITLGIIFYLIFTPISISMKIFGRDELNLRKKSLKSFWKTRNDINFNNKFEKQF